MRLHEKGSKHHLPLLGIPVSGAVESIEMAPSRRVSALWAQRTSISSTKPVFHGAASPARNLAGPWMACLSKRDAIVDAGSLKTSFRQGKIAEDILA
ncbi:hypothetical protein [Cupriavidus necator]|uniref:hypothetical protein n=1 Tax=Cupriavidus necator TaxID=106590 RepID=UPI0005B4907C|nr:hypothetical protein [Cupriavidus necator]